MKQIKQFLIDCIQDDKEPVLKVSVGSPAEETDFRRKAGLPVLPPIETLALVDTGADICAVDASVAEQLEARKIDISDIHGTDDSVQERYVYALSVSLLDLDGSNINFVRAIDLPLKSLSLGFVIGRNLLFAKDPQPEECSASRQSVDKQAPPKPINEQCLEFRRLLDSGQESDIQRYIETHHAFLSPISAANTILTQSPILTNYRADFVLINSARKEVVLVEIERPDLPLVLKDGGINAKLQHAFDQVKRWLQVFRADRATALKCIGLRPDEVVKIRGAVVAGRTDQTVRFDLLRSSTWEDVVFFSYDDILHSLERTLQVLDRQHSKEITPLRGRRE